MQRSKDTNTGRQPKPTGSWLAGMLIGSAIITMATGAAMIGATMAIRDSGTKRSGTRGNQP
jgi:hypothetical protein